MNAGVLVVVVVVFLKFLLRQEIIVTRVNDSLSQMSQMLPLCMNERSRNNQTNFRTVTKVSQDLYLALATFKQICLLVCLSVLIVLKT